MANTQQFVKALDGLAQTRVKVWADIVTDLTNLRTSITTLTAKLDADVVTGLDDDYAATCDPPALVTKV